jgi:hypothetical protein
MSIDVRQAVNAAKEFVLKVYDQKEIPRLLLEEVELSDDQKLWYITFGFKRGEIRKKPTLSSIMNFGGTSLLETIEEDRAYKVVTVDAEKGNAVRMTIRSL